MNRPILILALLAALSCCQAAPAQARAGVSVQSTPGYSQITLSDSGGSLVLVVGPNEQVTAVRNGSVLPADRLQHEDDHLRVLDEDGETLYDIRLLPDGGLIYPYDAQMIDGRLHHGSAPVAAWAAPTPPRKIIGVTVDPVDAVVASQLGLEPESAFVISSVTPELPAAQAGVQAHDVVISIQGEQPATVEKLREAVEGKQPGETIKLELLRRGQRLELDVGVTTERTAPKFYAFDGDADSTAAWADFMVDSAAMSEGATSLARSYSERAMRQAEEMEAATERMVELQEEYRQAAEELEQARQASASGDAEARDELASRQNDLDVLRAQLREQQVRLQSSSGAMQLLDLRNGGRALMVPPNSSAFGGNAADPRLDGVDDRLRAMDERLARLEELLKKLVESDAAGK